MPPLPENLKKIGHVLNKLAELSDEDVIYIVAQMDKRLAKAEQPQAEEE